MLQFGGSFQISIEKKKKRTLLRPTPLLLNLCSLSPKGALCGSLCRNLASPQRVIPEDKRTKEKVLEMGGSFSRAPCFSKG